jgi:hemolysin III
MLSDDKTRVTTMIGKLKDPLSGLTHFIGICLAVVGLILLILESSDPVKPWHIATFCVFSVGMILLYLASTLYHWLPLSKVGSRRLKKFDHMMIFVMIAASYTPICLIPLRGPLGWSLFGCIWGIAAAGLFFKVFWIQAPRWLSTIIYVLMGWLAVIAIVPMARVLQPGAVFWLVNGGVLYTLGAIIYAVKRPDPWPSVFGFHEIFHVFVMAGSFSHFMMMYNYLTLLD